MRCSMQVRQRFLAFSWRTKFKSTIIRLVGSRSFSLFCFFALSLSLSMCVCVCIYIYTNMCICVCVYIYIYIYYTRTYVMCVYVCVYILAMLNRTHVDAYVSIGDSVSCFPHSVNPFPRTEAFHPSRATCYPLHWAGSARFGWSCPSSNLFSARKLGFRV